MIGVGENKPYIDISDIIDIDTYMTLDNKIKEDIVYSCHNDKKFKDYFLGGKNVQTVEQLYKARLCGALECAGGVEGCPDWTTGILSRLGYLLDFWSNYFEIDENFYSKFHLRFDFSTNLKNENMGDTDAGSIDNDELHNNIMKDFHNNESCIRIWTTTSEQKKGIYLYDWEEKILHKTKGNAIIFTPSDYHGSLENSTGFSIMIDPLINDPIECKNEQLNDYLHKANEWRNNKVIEYKNREIDISKAWGVHYGE